MISPKRCAVDPLARVAANCIRPFGASSSHAHLVGEPGDVLAQLEVMSPTTRLCTARSGIKVPFPSREVA